VQIIVVQPGLYVTAIATTIIGIHTAHTHALKLTYFYYFYRCMSRCYEYTHTHALQLNYRANGRRVPRHQERGVQWPRATLNYYCANVGSKRHQGHRGTCGVRKESGTQEGPEGARGIQETPVGPEGTAGGSEETPIGPGGTTGGSERAASQGDPKQLYILVLYPCPSPSP
jgi:hypothetical protein